MASQTPTAGIILAAGESVRFGSSKQLLKLREKHLIEWVVDAALGSCLQAVHLVLGHDHLAIQQALGAKIEHPKLTVNINPEYRKGQSTSLRTGLSKVRKSFGAVMFLLGDQPMITADFIDRMLDQFEHSDKEICVPVCNARQGNPVIFRKPLYDDLMQVKGDIGARNIIRKNPDRTLFLQIDDPLCFLDIDTPQDLKFILTQKT